MFGIGAGEFIVILIVALIVFGPSKLPEVGRAIGKGLREFRKAQAALSATLNEPDEPPKKISQSQAVTADDVINSAKERPLNEPPKKSSHDEKISQSQAVTADDVINLAKENPLNEPPKKSSHDEKISQSQAVTADDVINLAKERPIVKENQHEKIFNGNPNDAAVDDARASVAGAGSSSNGIGEQSKPSTDGTVNPNR